MDFSHPSSPPSPEVTFDHLTINTGHNCRHADYFPDGPAADRLGAFVRPGWHLVPVAGTEDLILPMLLTNLQPGHVVFTLFLVNPSLPVLTCHACLDPQVGESVWLKLITAHRDEASVPAGLPDVLKQFTLTMAPVRRPPGCFLSVHLQAGLPDFPGPVGWLGWFERNFYWHLWADARKEIRREVPARR